MRTGKKDGWNMHYKQKREVGARIRKSRKEIGMTQSTLADLLGVTNKAISSYEVGRTTPNFDLVQRLADALGKPISYFDTGEHLDDLDIEIKLKTIEKELADIREILKKREEEN